MMIRTQTLSAVFSLVTFVGINTTTLTTTPVEAQELVVQDAQAQGPVVSAPVIPHLSSAVRTLPAATPTQTDAPVPEINPRRRGSFEPEGTGEETFPEDPLLADTAGKSSLKTPAPFLSFEGISRVTGGSGVPPDPIGDVGPNHYVQMVNTSFAIFDKSGNLLTGPTNINQLWAGQGGLCQTHNDGDPVVLYRDPI